MNIADVVSAMATAGCSADQIAQAIEALTDRRSAGAIRQARYRARKAEASLIVTSVTSDVTERNVTSPTPSPLFPPDKETSPTPPKEINPPISPQPHVSGVSEDDEFERWYQNFPNKVGKADARKAWPAARKLASYEKLCGGLRRYLAKTDDRPWCNPATWLRQGRWDDEPAAVARGSPFQKPLSGMALIDQQIALEIENERYGSTQGGNSESVSRLSFFGEHRHGDD